MPRLTSNSIWAAPGKRGDLGQGNFLPPRQFLMRVDGRELSANDLPSSWRTESVNPEGGVCAVQPSFHDGKKIVLSFMEGSEMGVEDRTMLSPCHQPATTENQGSYRINCSPHCTDTTHICPGYPSLGSSLTCCSPHIPGADVCSASWLQRPPGVSSPAVSVVMGS